MTNTTAAAVETAAAPIKNECLCSKYEAVTREFDTQDGPDYDAETTGCNESTTREFAPGHDAKLKALLIRAGVNGWAIRYGSITTSAEKAASGFAFGYMVEAGIERGRGKAAAKADKKAARAERPARTRKATGAPAASTREHVVAAVAQAGASFEAEATPAQAETVKVKIGRWEYSATVDAAGDAHYVTAKGAAAVAVKGTYKEL